MNKTITPFALESVSVRPGSTERAVLKYGDVSTGLLKPQLAKKLAVSDAPHLSRLAGAKDVTVYVGMSGGVDSSVTAAILKDQGYTVVGVYMKNWTQDMPGFPCPWKDDFQDAKRVAVQLGIDFKVYDFEKDYKQKVVDYMVREYSAGNTPNPDIMCNQEIKFSLFLDAALEDGADMIATGHYAKTKAGKLLQAANADKDQTYFLYRVTKQALQKTLFPIGDYKTKVAVRQLAKKYGLATAAKKDSQGICFVGKVGIREFLSQYVDTEPGNIIDQDGEIVGQHDGAIFYTIGQRHGLSVGGGLPYYVVNKDMKKNEVFVTTKIDDEKLWSNELKIAQIHWINRPAVESRTYQVRTRHRAAFIPCTYQDGKLILKSPIRARTPGQSAVIYDGQVCLGGGILT